MTKCKRVYRQSIKIEAPRSFLESHVNPRYNEKLILENKKEKGWF